MYAHPRGHAGPCPGRLPHGRSAGGFGGGARQRHRGRRRRARDPARRRPHVFDRFYRAAAQDGFTEPGSGLGLAIATAHDGRLELGNRPGEGCTFRLLLPHRPPEPHVGTW
ncbi:ATP-binding protein [Streptomyces goshikiensis]|uniref:ATP-binding protein n=1 Tax=Streptomyces goshikiensis TaxID=1942 RepID=UPI00369EFD07